MTTALANVEYRPTIIDTERLGQIMVKSGFFGDTRDAAQAVVKILAGAELGFGPLASMQGVYIVKGRVTLSANMVGAAIQRSGKYAYRVIAIDSQKCSIDFFEGSQKIGESVFTMDDAKKAGLAGGNYDKFARNMLFSRALTNGARWFCPEVFNGPIYTPDEMGAAVERDGRIVDVETGEVLGQPEYVPTRERDPEPRMVTSTDDRLYKRYAELFAEAMELGLEPDTIEVPVTADRVTQMGVELSEAIKKKRAEVAAEDEPF